MYRCFVRMFILRTPFYPVCPDNHSCLFVHKNYLQAPPVLYVQGHSPEHCCYASASFLASYFMAMFLITSPRLITGLQNGRSIGIPKNLTCAIHSPSSLMLTPKRKIKPFI
jgi:hypothetical protein